MRPFSCAPQCPPLPYRRTFPEQLVGLDHAGQASLMSPVTAVTVGVIAADQFGIAPPQSPEIGVEAQSHRLERLRLFAAEAAVHRHFGFALGAAPDAACPGSDGIERIVEVGPARHSVDAGGRPERVALRSPPGGGRLRGKNLLRAHPFEPVVTRIEFAHVIEAEPAPVAGSVERVSLRPGCAKLSGLRTSRHLASAARARISAMELRLLHAH